MFSIPCKKQTFMIGIKNAFISSPCKEQLIVKRVNDFALFSSLVRNLRKSDVSAQNAIGSIEAGGE